MSQAIPLQDVPPDSIGASRLPRYARVADRLVADISSGRYAVDGFLPSEASLCQEFGVSRATVREALRQLSDRGLVSRIHGIGTRVNSPGAAGSFLLSVKSAADFMQYGSQTVLHVLRRTDVRLDGARALILGAGRDRDWVKVSGVRSLAGQDGEPIAYSEIYINARFADVAAEAPTPGVPFHEKIAERHRQSIVSIGQLIRAVAIDGDQARLLGVPEGSPGLEILRHFYGPNDLVLEMTVNLHPAGRFSYRLFVTRGGVNGATPAED